jgi:hypothetical protein
LGLFDCEGDKIEVIWAHTLEGKSPLNLNFTTKANDVEAMFLRGKCPGILHKHVS